MRTTILILLWAFIGSFSGFANNYYDEILMLTDDITFTQFPPSVKTEGVFAPEKDSKLVALLESLSTLKSELKWVATAKTEVQAWIMLLQL